MLSNERRSRRPRRTRLVLGSSIVLAAVGCQNVVSSSPEGTTTTYVEESGVLVYAPRAARAQKVVFDDGTEQLIHAPDTPLRRFFDAHSSDFQPGMLDRAKTTILEDIVARLRNREYVRASLDQVLERHLDRAFVSRDAVAPIDTAAHQKAERRLSMRLLRDSLHQALMEAEYPHMRDEVLENLLDDYTCDPPGAAGTTAPIHSTHHIRRLERREIWKRAVVRDGDDRERDLHWELLHTLRERGFFRLVIADAVAKRLSLFRSAANPGAPLAAARKKLTSIVTDNLGEALVTYLAGGTTSLRAAFLDLQNKDASPTIRSVRTQKAMTPEELRAFGRDLWAEVAKAVATGTALDKALRDALGARREYMVPSVVNANTDVAAFAQIRAALKVALMSPAMSAEYDRLTPIAADLKTAATSVETDTTDNDKAAAAFSGASTTFSATHGGLPQGVQGGLDAIAAWIAAWQKLDAIMEEVDGEVQAIQQAQSIPEVQAKLADFSAKRAELRVKLDQARGTPAGGGLEAMVAPLTQLTAPDVGVAVAAEQGARLLPLVSNFSEILAQLETKRTPAGTALDATIAEVTSWSLPSKARLTAAVNDWKAASASTSTALHGLTGRLTPLCAPPNGDLFRLRGFADSAIAATSKLATSRAKLAGLQASFDAVLGVPETTGPSFIGGMSAALRQANLNLATPDAHQPIEELMAQVRARVIAKLVPARAGTGTFPTMEQVVDYALQADLRLGTQESLERFMTSFTATFKGLEPLVQSDEPILAAILRSPAITVATPSARESLVATVTVLMGEKWQATAVERRTLETYLALLKEVLDSSTVAYLFLEPAADGGVTAAFKEELYQAFSGRLDEVLEAERQAQYDYWWLTFYPKAIPLGEHRIEGQSVIEVGFPARVLPEEQFHRWLKDNSRDDDDDDEGPRVDPYIFKERSDEPARVKGERVADVLTGFLEVFLADELTGDHSRVLTAIRAAQAKLDASEREQWAEHARGEAAEDARHKREKLVAAERTAQTTRQEAARATVASQEAKDEAKTKDATATELEEAARIAHDNAESAWREAFRAFLTSITHRWGPLRNFHSQRAQESRELANKARRVALEAMVAAAAARVEARRASSAADQAADTLQRKTEVMDEAERAADDAKLASARADLAIQAAGRSKRADDDWVPPQPYQLAVKALLSSYESAGRLKSQADPGRLLLRDLRQVIDLTVQSGEHFSEGGILALMQDSNDESALFAPHGGEPGLVVPGQTLSEEGLSLDDPRVQAALERMLAALPGEISKAGVSGEGDRLRALVALKYEIEDHFDDQALASLMDSLDAGTFSVWLDMPPGRKQAIRRRLGCLPFDERHVIVAVLSAVEGTVLPAKVDLYLGAYFGPVERYQVYRSDNHSFLAPFERWIPRQQLMLYLERRLVERTAISRIDTLLRYVDAKLSDDADERRKVRAKATGPDWAKSLGKIDKLMADTPAERRRELSEAWPAIERVLAWFAGLPPRARDGIFVELARNVVYSVPGETKSTYLELPELWLWEMRLDASRAHLRRVISHQFGSSYPAAPTPLEIQDNFLADEANLHALVYHWLRDLYVQLRREGVLGRLGHRETVDRRTTVGRLERFLDGQDYLTGDVRRDLIEQFSSSSSIYVWMDAVTRHTHAMDQLRAALLPRLYSGLWQCLSQLASSARRPVDYRAIRRGEYEEFLRWGQAHHQANIQIIDLLPASRDDLVGISINEGGVIAQAAGLADGAVAYDVNELEMSRKNASILRQRARRAGERLPATGTLLDTLPGEGDEAGTEYLDDLSRLGRQTDQIGGSLGATAQGSIYARARAALAYSRRREYLDAAITAAGRGDNFAKWVIRKSDVRSAQAELNASKLVAAAHNGYPNGDQPFHMLVRIPHAAQRQDWSGQRFVYFNSAYSATRRTPLQAQGGWFGWLVKALSFVLHPPLLDQEEEGIVGTVYPFKWDVADHEAQRELMQDANSLAGKILLDDTDKIRYSEVKKLIDAEAGFIRLTRSAQSAELGKVLETLQTEAEELHGDVRAHLDERRRQAAEREAALLEEEEEAESAE